MQRLYDIVQTRLNIQLKFDALHNNNDLETKLALVMNTKVVPHAIINMFKAFPRFHTHFIHRLRENPSINDVIKESHMQYKAT